MRAPSESKSGRRLEGPILFGGHVNVAQILCHILSTPWQCILSANASTIPALSCCKGKETLLMETPVPPPLPLIPAQFRPPCPPRRLRKARNWLPPPDIGCTLQHIRNTSNFINYGQNSPSKYADSATLQYILFRSVVLQAVATGGRGKNVTIRPSFR